jgi:hypothetical protein
LKINFTNKHTTISGIFLLIWINEIHNQPFNYNSNEEFIREEKQQKKKKTIHEILLMKVVYEDAQKFK